MDSNRNRANDHLGINKISKNIRKSPLHQPTFTNPRQQQQGQQQQQNSGGGNQQQPQPQVYNINKNDFRSVVQRLTGTPTRDPFPFPNPAAPARPTIHNPPKPPSMRLQKIRPPPLTPIARPPVPHPVNPIPNPNFFPRPTLAAAAGPIQSPAIPFSPLLPPTPPLGNALWGNTLESPISAYMRDLEGSMLNADGFHQATAQQMPAQLPQQAARPLPGQMQQMPPSSHLAHQPLPPLQQDQMQVTGPAASFTGLLPNPHVAVPFPSPRGVCSPFLAASAGLLPSPTSQFILPSPSAFLNLLSPRSPFPLLSPLSPGFAFSPMGGQSGILGPGPQPPPSPHMLPLSPSGFLPIMSPRWRDL